MPGALKSTLGPWIADIAANFLAIILVVLIIVAAMPPTDAVAPRAQELAPRLMQPVAGADAVEILRQKVLSDPDRALVELSADGMAELGGSTEPRVLILLTQDRYADVVDMLESAGNGWVEFVPPAALTDGSGRWAEEFLALSPVATDPTRFRNELVALLDRRSARRASALSEEDAARGDPMRLMDRVAGWLRVGKDIASALLLGFFCIVFVAVKRWAVRA